MAADCPDGKAGPDVVSTVAFDDSTTVGEMFPYVAARRPCAVITHSLRLMQDHPDCPGGTQVDPRAWRRALTDSCDDLMPKARGKPDPLPYVRAAKLWHSWSTYDHCVSFLPVSAGQREPPPHDEAITARRHIKLNR